MRVSTYLKKWFPAFALPTTLAFVLAFLVPFGMGLYLSFTKFRVITDAQWIGLNNYTQAFSEKNNNFLHALWFSVRFTVVSVIVVNVLAFTFAMLLTKAIRATNLFRAVFFLPNLIGGIVLGYIWMLLLNAILDKLFKQDLTYNSAYGFWGLVIVNSWQMVGYMMIIYIAGIQNIPGDVIEAAEIDGAPFWPRLFRVTIPMVASSITICTFLTLTNSLKLFDQNLSLTGGAPQQGGVYTTAGLSLDIFRTFYLMRNRMGVGQAKAVVFFVIVAAIAFIQLRATRSREEH